MTDDQRRRLIPRYVLKMRNTTDWRSRALYRLIALALAYGAGAKLVNHMAHDLKGQWK